MLFVATLKRKDLSPKETMARRLNWSYPEGVKLIAEYWLQGSDLATISILETDDHAAILAVTTTWADAFDIKISPAMTAEDGMAIAKKMMG
jgi:hypothetical protein